MPEVVSEQEWQFALDAQTVREKTALRTATALAAERRRLPAVEVRGDYAFEGPEGTRRLLDLFDGRRQLIVYHFMFGPNQTVGCPGCSMFVDQIGHPAHLKARDTSLVLVSRAPLAAIEPYRRRMGWTLPWYSSAGSSFNPDMGVGPERPAPGAAQDGEHHGLSVFLRDGDAVYRTYFTTDRGVEPLGTVWSLLDVTPMGRQEVWEDSPDGTPQSAPYEWWRRHDEYED
jgi:predicted dithiol-disulfide oxidoreductase (DUF899 family)